MTSVRQTHAPTGRPAAVTIPPRARSVLQAIGRLAEVRRAPAYAVGGCVRDWLLGRTGVTDLDVTVEGDGIALAQDAAAEFAAPLTVHRQFGTATLALHPAARRPAGAVNNPVTAQPALRVDIATCRRETYAKPAAYPRVVRGTIQDDLFRRDFTINAMAAALAPAQFGALLDPFGGVSDLRRRRLRILHLRSFLDDPSRILRGVRFAERFGLQWEPRTRQALEAAMADGALGRLNAGRLRKELEFIGREPDPAACLRHLERLLAAAGDADPRLDRLRARA